MRTVLYTHPDCLAHFPGEDHPDQPERLAAVLRAFEQEEFHYLARDVAPSATVRQLTRAHDQDYVDGVLKIELASGCRLNLDEDTVISASSVQAALHAAGAVCAAVDDIAGRRSDHAFCAVRPPGHHAERARAMGFCIFNNAAIGLLHARDAHGFRRVALLDFDVHHGNGSQQILASEPGTFYASTHQQDLYPFSGAADDKGEPGRGLVFNVPLPAGSGSAPFRAAYESVIFPALREFAPDFLFLSAGFDGHARDPLAHLRLTVADFNWLTQQCVLFARAYCGDRLVSVLEGGYDLDALIACVLGHMRVLMHE